MAVGRGSRPDSQAGNALVEFALVAPILFFLFLGMVVLGLAINAKIVVSGAAREGARFYAVTQDPACARRAVGQAIAYGGLRSRFQGQVLFDPWSDQFLRPGSDGRYVWVEVTYRQPVFVPYLPKLLNPSAPALSTYLDITSRALFLAEWVEPRPCPIH